MQGLTFVVAWTALTLGVSAALFLVAFFVLRWRVVRRVEAELGVEGVLLVTLSRLGRIDGAAAESAPRMDAGFLLLLVTGLYFHSWFGSREVFIPGASITYIGARGESPREKRAIALRFLNASGKEDGLVVRLMYPEQWVDAIKTHLITRVS